MRSRDALRPLLTVMLCLAIGLGASWHVPLSWQQVHAADDTAHWQGSGTPEDPYLIANAAQLDGMRSHPTASFRLTADIDLSGFEGEDGKGWVPIGTIESPFSGTFDGAGYSILHLKINRADQSYVGLFGYASGAQIRNAAVTYAEVRGRSFVGGLVGSADGAGIIENSYVLDGIIEGSRDVISLDLPTDEFDMAELSMNVGGLAGYQAVPIRDSFAAADVLGSMAVGGLVGYSAAEISESYAEGRVTGNGQAGGLIGINASGNRISASYAVGDTHTDITASGGFVGVNYGAISRSFALGRAGGNGLHGGFAGSDESGGYSLMEHCFWNADSGSANNGFCTPLATEQFRDVSAFGESLDFEHTWIMQPDDAHPRLLPRVSAGPVALPDLNGHTAALSGAMRYDVPQQRVKIEYEIHNLLTEERIPGDSLSVISTGAIQDYSFQPDISALADGSYELLVWTELRSGQRTEARTVPFTINHGAARLDLITDIEGHRYEQAVRAAVLSGLVRGYPDGTFRPDEPATRMELASILVRAFQLEGDGIPVRVSDREQIPDWAEEDILAVLKSGLLRLDASGAFLPDAEVSRLDFIAAIVEALKLPMADFSHTPYTDDADIPYAMKPYVITALWYGLVPSVDSENRLLPNLAITRAEAVDILTRSVNIR